MGLRRILIIIVAIVFTSTVGYFAYRYVEEMSTPEPDPMTAVPGDVVLILETNDLEKLWDKLANKSIVWENLKAIEFFDVLNETGVLLDSAVSRTERLNGFVEENKFILSVHQQGRKKEYFVACLSKGFSVEELNSSIQEASMSGIRTEGISLSGTPGFHLQSGTFGNWYFTIVDGVVVASTSQILVESSVKNVGEAVPKGLEKVRSEQQNLDKAVGRVYLKYDGFMNLTTDLLQESEGNLIKNAESVANWGGFDLYLGPDKVSMHGMSSYEDSELYSILGRQEPVRIKIPRLLPENTASVFAVGISDRQKFIEDYRTAVYGTDAQKHLEELEAQSDRYGADFEHDLLSWIGEEVAVFTTRTEDSILTDNQFLALAIDPLAENPGQRLSDLSATVAAYFGETVDTVRFRGITIRSIKLPVDYSFLFGELFGSIDNPHFAVIDDYVVFANSVKALRRLIRDRSFKTLGEGVHFNRFMDNNLSDKSNVLIFNNVSNSLEYLKAKLNRKHRNLVGEYVDVLSQFEGAAWQMVNSGDGVFYSNIALVHNPQEKDERLTLWEVHLEHPLSEHPQTIYNHRTQTREVVAMDTSNTMYLVSNTGKLKWKKQLDGPINGDIKQVDIFNNGKLQMLFNTDDKLYLVDILGRDVTGFPVQLPTSSSSTVAVFDYANDHDYRFVLGLMDHRVIMYDKEGKRVQGWSFTAKSPIDVEPIHHRIGTRDYIIMVDNEDNVYAQNRRGEERYESDATLAGRTGSAWFEPTSDIATCRFVYRDTSGTIHRVKLSGVEKTISLNGLRSYSWFSYNDMGGDKGVDYIYSSLGQVNCYGRNKSLHFEYSLPSAEDMRYNYVDRGEDLTFVVYLDPVTGEVGVINRQGERQNDFPIIGYGGATIDDLNGDDMFELITGGTDGHLYAYPMR